MKNKKIITLFITLTTSSYAFSYGKGVCVTFADGHGQCISDVDRNGEMAQALRKQASDSFKTNDYIDRAKESAIDMLVKSSKQYKEGLITKNQFVEVALQVSQMADYAIQNSNPVATTAEPEKNKDIKLIDKKIKAPDTIPFGAPNIENISDEQLKKLENKEKEIPALRSKFKELQNSQKNLGLTDLNLKCTNAADCIFLPVGHKLCGGPQSYLLLSKLDPNFASTNEKLTKFTELDEDFQKILHGFAGMCDYVMSPKAVCQNNMCAKN